MKCERTRTKERWTWAEVGERKNERTNERTNKRERERETRGESRVKSETENEPRGDGELSANWRDPAFSIACPFPFVRKHRRASFSLPLFNFPFFFPRFFHRHPLSRQVASPSGRGLVRFVVAVVVVMSSPPGKISSPGPATLGSLIMPGHLQASRPLRACSGMIHVSRCTDKTTIFISVAAANATTSKLRHRVLRFKKKVPCFHV